MEVGRFVVVDMGIFSNLCVGICCELAILLM